MPQEKKSLEKKLERMVLVMVAMKMKMRKILTVIQI
jgi:hypothetical protein